jgi:hypothetical protein
MSELSEKVLLFTKRYLGPASQTFLERQAKNHMKGLAFNDIKEEHLPELFKWIHTSARLIIDDRADALLKSLETVFHVKKTA